jgi:DeoR/GlpR family transcriptional regulator of sugar metabolism
MQIASCQDVPRIIKQFQTLGGQTHTSSRQSRSILLTFRCRSGTVLAVAASGGSSTDVMGTRALARQRHEVILSEVRQRGAVRVIELAAQLGVSDMTIRRDLDALDEAGLIEKVHGGATALTDRSADEPGFAAKSLRNTNEKMAIARAAATLVRSGTAIGVTAGTTTWQLAYHLTEIANLIVVTNSIRVAEVLHQSQRADRTVILTGGERTPSDALVGPVAVQALRTLHFDAVFMGVHGMSDRAGFTTPNLMEAETNRAFAEATQRLVVVADHTKWNVTGLSSIAPLHSADTVVTDAGMASSAHQSLAEHVPRVLIADPAEPDLDSVEFRRRI